MFGSQHTSYIQTLAILLLTKLASCSYKINEAQNYSIKPEVPKITVTFYHGTDALTMSRASRNQSEGPLNK